MSVHDSPSVCDGVPGAAAGPASQAPHTPLLRGLFLRTPWSSRLSRGQMCPWQRGTLDTHPCAGSALSSAAFHDAGKVFPMAPSAVVR